MKDAMKGCCCDKQTEKLNEKEVIKGLRKKEVTCSFSVTSMTKGNSVHIINEREIREDIR